MILASEEQITQYRETGCWGERTLIDDYKLYVAANPQRIAFIDPSNKQALVGMSPERVSFAVFDRAVDAVATALRARGIGKDDIVLAQLPNIWELGMLYVAVARAGGVLSALPMQWRSKELLYVGGLTEAKAFITVEKFHNFDHLAMGGEVQASLPALKQLISFPQLREMMLTEPSAKLDSIPLDANEIFTLCWTSGTEAEPKGCPLSHNNWRCLSDVAFAGGITPGATLFTAAPLTNMGGVGTVLITG